MLRVRSGRMEWMLITDLSAPGRNFKEKPRKSCRGIGDRFGKLMSTALIGLRVDEALEQAVQPGVLSVCGRLSDTRIGNRSAADAAVSGASPAG
jgi:hypothetical protein